MKLGIVRGWLFVALFLVPFAASCGSIPGISPPKTTSGSPGNFAGTWTGTWHSGKYSQSGSLSITITQNGAAISGTGKTTGVGAGSFSFSGTVDGNSVTWGMVSNTTTSYTGTLDGDTLSGTYSDSSDGNYGTWTVTRPSTSTSTSTGSGTGTNTGTGDTKAPTVSTVVPASGAKGIAVDDVITATFSETMAASTISTTTFKVAGATGLVTYSGNAATFTPSPNLAYGTKYTATITKGVQDSAGNAMASDYTWSFTTKNGPPPTNVSKLAGDWAVGKDISFTVAADGSITNFVSTLPVSGDCFGGQSVAATYSNVTIDKTDFSFSASYTKTQYKTTWSSSLSASFTSNSTAEGKWSASVSNICSDSSKGTFTAVKK